MIHDELKFRQIQQKMASQDLPWWGDTTNAILWPGEMVLRTLGGPSPTRRSTSWPWRDGRDGRARGVHDHAGGAADD